MSKQAKKIGRPKTLAGETSQVGIKVSNVDRALWERAATLDRRGLSDWCRLALNQAAKDFIAKHETQS